MARPTSKSAQGRAFPQGPAPIVDAEPPEDAESYAVRPELDVLNALAEPGPREDEDEAAEVLWFDVVVA